MNLNETLAKLRYLLATTATVHNHHQDALALLEKAISKAQQDKEYERQMRDTLLRGSTVQLREWLSVFGEYMEPPRSTYPWYPHHDAVNGIDSAMGVIKWEIFRPGAMQEHIEFMTGVCPASLPDFSVEKTYALGDSDEDA